MVHSDEATRKWQEIIIEILSEKCGWNVKPLLYTHDDVSYAVSQVSLGVLPAGVGRNSNSVAE